MMQEAGPQAANACSNACLLRDLAAAKASAAAAGEAEVSAMRSLQIELRR